MRVGDLLRRGFIWRQPAASAAQSHAWAPKMSAPKTRRRLFAKYVALFVAVVCLALLSNGVFDVFFYYQEPRPRSFASNANKRKPPPPRSGSSSRRSRASSAGRRNCLGRAGSSRAAPFRRAAPVAPSSRYHRARSARRHRQGAAAGVRGLPWTSSQAAQISRATPEGCAEAVARKVYTARFISAVNPSRI